MGVNSTVQQKIIEEISELSLAQQTKLLDFIRSMKVHDGREAGNKFSIVELKGLGKEMWSGIDAQEYVDELRKEWDER